MSWTTHFVEGFALGLAVGVLLMGAFATILVCLGADTGDE